MYQQSKKAHSYKPYQSSHQQQSKNRSKYQSSQPITQRSILDSTSRELQLITNAYSVISTKQNYPLFKYSLIIQPSHGKQVSDHVMHKSYVARAIRNHIMDKVVPCLVDETPTTVQSIVISWSLDALYSNRPLKLFDQKDCDNPTIEINNYEEIVCQKQSIQIDLNTSLSMNIIIRKHSSFDLKSVEHKYELVSAILHHQLMIEMIKYGSVYFKPTNSLSNKDHRLDLISELTLGFNISGLLSCVDGSNIVIINSSRSYLTEAHRLIDLVASFIMGKAIRGVEVISMQTSSCKQVSPIRELIETSCSDEWWTRFKNFLNGYKCIAQVGQKQFSVRFSLSEEPASSQLIISSDGKSRVTVLEQYKRLGIELTYPNLPCLVSRYGWFPLELCTLEAGQKSPIFRLSSKAAANLISLNKQIPNDSKRLSALARDQIVSISQTQMDNFGISLSCENVLAKGSSLQKPMLQFSDRNFSPNRDLWESGPFCEAMSLAGNWCVINTAPLDRQVEQAFFHDFSFYCRRFGFYIEEPLFLDRPKNDFLENPASMGQVINQCQLMTNGNLSFLMFIIDSSSTQLNRLIHLSFDDNPRLTATCLRIESILNNRQHKSIYRTLVHKLNARLGGTNVTYHEKTLGQLNLVAGDLLVIGLDVTHPDNELNGVSIVGCAYTFTNDLFKHKSLVWPQKARTEIIAKIDVLMRKLLGDYKNENKGCLPKHIIIYRDGVSHEEFHKVRDNELSKAQMVITECARTSSQRSPSPRLSFIVAQKRHTMRFYERLSNNDYTNPPSGTIIDQDIVTKKGSEFYLYSNINNHSTSRPLHYHVLLDGLGIGNIQKLTYYLCFNFGKCSGTLSMPSSLKYAHNAAYDARNRVIAAREFSENKFYSSKFFC